MKLCAGSAIAFQTVEFKTQGVFSLFRSIRWRLISYYLVVIGIIVIAIGVFFIWFLNHFYMQTLRENLYSQARLAGALVEEKIDDDIFPAEIDRLFKNLGSELKIRLTLIASDGTVLADSDENPALMENHDDRPEIIEAWQQDQGTATRHSATLKEDMYYLAVPLKLEGETSGGKNSALVIRLALPLSTIDRALANLKLFILGALFVSFLLASGAAVILSHRFTDPISKIRSASRAIAEGNFEPPLEIKGDDELAKLAGNIKAMGQSLSGQIEKVTGEKNKLEIVVKSMSSGIILTDREMKIELINPAAEKLFDINGKEMIGASLQNVIRNYSLYETLKAVHRDGESRLIELNIFYPRAAAVETYLIPVAGPAENLIGVLLLFHEVTQLRTIEKMRSDFVANVSHELRTPLTAVRGYTETILHEELNHQQLIEFLQIIDRETKRLSALLDDLLDLAQIENEKGYVKKEAVNLKTLIKEAVSRVEDLRLMKDVSIEVVIPETELTVLGNYEWLNQALVNVLENSIKHGKDKGIVKVLLSKEDQVAVIKISDDGPGIPDADLPYVFERFYRVDKARTRKSGGTGLGLSIVKHIMEAHAAEYSLQSKEGSGTVFRFSIPLFRY